MPWYEKIADALGYSIQKDREATLVLKELLTQAASPIERLRNMVSGKDAIVFGAGPSLESNLSSLVSTGLEKTLTLIAADGATTAFLNESITPHIVVTDLDGRLEDIIKASKQGSVIVVHAHGDNMEALRKWVPAIIERKNQRVFGTTQVEPFPPVIYNFGGFTDGDRGAFLAEEMGAKTIILAGMDLGTNIGEYSKVAPLANGQHRDDGKWLSQKMLKLQFARELLEWLATWSRARGGLFNATGLRGQMIRGFPRIDFRVLLQIAKLTGSGR
jgi:hypothetical protein